MICKHIGDPYSKLETRRKLEIFLALWKCFAEYMYEWQTCKMLEPCSSQTAPKKSIENWLCPEFITQSWDWKYTVHKLFNSRYMYSIDGPHSSYFYNHNTSWHDTTYIKLLQCITNNVKHTIFNPLILHYFISNSIACWFINFL